MPLNQEKLPEKTVERLSQYRRTLLNYFKSGKLNIFSHELAKMLHLTSVQVRRDIMLIGYSGSQRKGYDVKELINKIGSIIDTKEGQNVAIIGMGSLGGAITRYFKGKRPKLNIVAAFDIDRQKFDKIISGIPCYSMEKLNTVIKKKNITLAIITMPPDNVTETAKKLVKSGIKGIVNYTSVPLNVSPNAYLEEYDMITSLEKAAYFAKTSAK
ncbi:MAG: redox-sensing transcriptional repressor Rex [Bacteroidales bacterium]|nr:redox-sensing transcriptional repressor Rex [Bacteroidales bacterium]